MPMQIKRGTNTQRLSYTPSQGELVFVTDYVSAGVDPLWIGDGTTTGGKTVSSSGSGLTELASDTTPELGGNLDLAGFEIGGIGDIDISGTISSSGAVTSPTFIGDFQGSVFGDDSSTLVDSVASRLTGIVDTSAVTVSADGSDIDLLVVQTSTTGGANDIKLRSHRGTVSSPTNITLGDGITDFVGQGYYSNAYRSATFIRFRTDTNGTITGNMADPTVGIPGTILFSTFGNDGTQGVPGTMELTQNGLLVGATSNPDSDQLRVGGDGSFTGNLVVSGSVTAGAMLLSGSNIDTDDSSAITVTPATTFSSDVTVENNMTVTNTLTVDTLEVTNFQTVGAGTPELESATDILLTAGTRVTVTQSPFKVASFTTVERDALSAENGDIIYNTTDNKFQGYENGAWANLI